MSAALLSITASVLRRSGSALLTALALGLAATAACAQAPAQPPSQEQATRQGHVAVVSIEGAIGPATRGLS